jgi:hypothetical protein
MINVLGLVAAAPWPTWLGLGCLATHSILAGLVWERARRRTYKEILTECPEGTVLIDASRRRCLVLWRPAAPLKLVSTATAIRKSR